MNLDTSVLLFGALCAGITALATSLFWYAALHRAEADAAVLGDALLDEVAAHRATSAAHAKCCDDLRQHGINGAARAKSLRVVK